MAMRMKTHTHSSMACFEQCPRKWEWKYVNRIRPSGTRSSLNFGSAFHAAVDVLREGGSLEEAFKKAFDEGGVEGSSWQKLVAMITGWAMVHQREKRVYAASEVHLKGNRLEGIVDAILEDKYGIAVVDTKTTSAGVGNLVDPMRISRQMFLYASLWHRIHGELPNRIIYDICLIPKIYPKKPAKKDVIDGEYFGVEVPDPLPVYETEEMFGGRVLEEVTSNLDKYFRWEVMWITPTDIKNALADVRGLMNEMDLAAQYPGLRRNTGSCMSYNRLCKFFDLCVLNEVPDPENVPMGFERVETAHMETKKK